MKFRYRRLARVNLKNGSEIPAASGLMGRLQATCGARRSAVPCKQLRAFTSVCVQLRAFASVFERARSRFVAFGRVWSRLVAPIFFSCSGTFGRVLSSFFVISRHFSSFFVPKWLFREWRQRVVAAAAGQGGQQFAARDSRAQGAGWAKWHGIHLKSVCSCGRAAAALVRLAHKCTTKAGRLQLLGIPGCISEWGRVSELR